MAKKPDQLSTMVNTDVVDTDNEYDIGDEVPQGKSQFGLSCPLGHKLCPMFGDYEVRAFGEDVVDYTCSDCRLDFQ